MDRREDGIDEKALRSLRFNGLQLSRKRKP